MAFEGLFATFDAGSHRLLRHLIVCQLLDPRQSAPRHAKFRKHPESADMPVLEIPDEHAVRFALGLRSRIHCMEKKSALLTHEEPSLLNLF